MGFLYAICSAFASSATDLTCKILSKEVGDSVLIAWAYRFFALPFLALWLFFIDIPTLDQSFFEALLIVGILNTIAYVLYMKAVEISDISAVAPITNFRPLFIMLTGIFLVGLYPTAFDYLGVLIILCGAYYSHLHSHSGDYWTPLRELASDRGVHIVFFATFLWGIVAHFQVTGIEHSSPIFWAIAQITFESLISFILVLIESRKHLPLLREYFRHFVLVGFWDAVIMTTQVLALSFTSALNVLAIRSLSGVIDVLAGHFWFGEPGYRHKAKGGLIMLLGVVVLVAW